MSFGKRKIEEDYDRKTKPRSECLQILNELERAIVTLSLTTAKAVTDWIQEQEYSSKCRYLKEEKQEQKEKLRNQIKNNEKGLFLAAVKYGNEICVDFFIKYGVDVNSVDDDGNFAPDYAWTNKNSKILFNLLEADSVFPKEFDVNELGEEDGWSKNIKNLVDERNALHKVIIIGTVTDVINLKFKKNSKLYLNLVNQSAAYVALRNKKIDTYAYLTSIGAEIKLDTERDILLNETEKGILEEARARFFNPSLNSHIFYLISKSRSQQQVPDLNDKLLPYYEHLNKIPEVALIMKVVQYAKCLDVVFDFEREDVSTICPTAERSSRGETVHKLGRIYVAAGLKKGKERKQGIPKKESAKKKFTQKEQEILGTIGHELTHMAMKMLYENECNPYSKTNENHKTFFDKFKEHINQFTRPDENCELKVLLAALDNYEVPNHHAELIVRIPHILIQFENGRVWIEKNISDLLSFYENEIQKKCEQFINESVLLKPRSIIKSLNESIGELVKVQRSPVSFKNVPNLLENSDAQVFVIEVKNTYLGMVKVLQGIYGKSYADCYYDFLVLKFRNFIYHESDVIQAFFLDGSTWLIIEILDEPSRFELNHVCSELSKVLTGKSYKKLVFVTHISRSEFVSEIVQNKFPESFCKNITEEEITLDSLDAESQTKILEKSLKFQGKTTSLQKLMPNNSSYKFVNAEIIEALLQDVKVHIGNEIFGLSDLEGAYYSDLIPNINFQSFIQEVEDSERSYFILKCNLNHDFKDVFDVFDEEPISAEFWRTNSWEFEGKIIREKIILVNDRFQDKDFKNFCKNHSDEKCYFIAVEDLKSRKFHLKLVYDPCFYVKRKIKKILVKSENINQLITQNRSDLFIISSDGEIREDSMKENDNLKCFDNEKAKIYFAKSKKPGNAVHWFQTDGEHFRWRDSHGPIKNLRKNICTNEGVLEEDKLVEEITDKKVVLIADNPGMGKTTTMTALCESKTIADTHWIIRINLANHLTSKKANHLRKRKKIMNAKKLNVKILLELLQDIYPILKSESNERLLEAVLTVENAISKTLLIAFDGFDELLDEEDRENVINLLKFLKSKTLCKIWITSRVQYKRELENHLGTFAMEFYPLDDEMKKLYVENYLKRRLNLILDRKTLREAFSKKENSKISTFTANLLSKMHEIFKKDTNKFIGTPLQLNLVMFESPEHFNDWIEGKISVLNFDYLGKNLLEVYESFIEKKYRVYFNKSNLTEETRLQIDKNNSEIYNKNLAESLVYKQEALKPKGKNLRKIILLIGLVQSTDAKNVEFIHFTFREFYFAKKATAYFSKAEIIEKIAFVFSEIFAKQEFEMIRNFLNITIQDKRFKVNLEKLTEKILSSESIVEPYTTFESALAIAAEEGHENLLKFFHGICRSHPKYRITNIFNQTFFCYATFGGEVQTWEVIFEILDHAKLETEWEKFYFKCLIAESACFASERGLQKLSAFLLTRIQNNFSTDEKQNFLKFAVKHGTVRKIVEAHTSSEIFQSYLEMIGNLFTNKEEREILMTANKNGPNLLFAAATKNDPIFMKLLLRKVEEIGEDERKLFMMRTKHNRTILHVAALEAKIKIMELIWGRAEKVFDFKGLQEFITVTDSKGQTALHHAVEQNRMELPRPPFLKKISAPSKRLIEQNHCEVVRFLTEAAEKSLPKDKFLEYIKQADKAKKTLLHSAFEKSSLVSLKLMFEQIEKILKPEEVGEWITAKDPEFCGSILISTCRRNDLNILIFLLQKAEQYLTSPGKFKEFLMARTESNRNALHFALEKNNLDTLKLWFEKFEEHLDEADQIQLLTMESQWIRMKGPFLVEAACSTKTNIIRYILKEKTNIFMESIKQKPPEIWRVSYSIVYHGSADLVQSMWDKMEECLSSLDQCQSDQLKSLSEEDTSFAHFLRAATFSEDSEVVKMVFNKMEENFLDKQKDLLMEKLTKEFSYINNHLCYDLTYLHMIVTIHCLHINMVCNGPSILKIFMDKMEKILSPHEIFQLLTYRSETISMEEGLPVLHMVANEMDTDLIEVILERIGNILSVKHQRELLMMNKSFSNENVLFWSSSMAILQLLTEKAEYILEKDDRCRLLMAEGARGTVFHKAVESSHPDILEFLLKKSQDTLTIESKNELMTKMIKFSPRSSSNKNQFLSNILHLAAFKGKTEILKHLLDYLFSYFDQKKQREFLMMENEVKKTPLHCILSTSESVEREAVALLLGKMEEVLRPEDWSKLMTVADGNIYTSILFTAALTRDADIVKLILQTGEKILKCEFSPLFTLEDENCGSVLHASVYNEDFKVVKLILEQGKKLLTPEKLCKFLNVANKDGRTVLHLAVSNDKYELEYGERYFPLKKSEKEKQLKFFRDRSEFVYLFLREAENVMEIAQLCRFLTLKDKDGKTALHIAVESQKFESVKLLLQVRDKAFQKSPENFITELDLDNKKALEIRSHTDNYFITNLLSAFNIY